MEILFSILYFAATLFFIALVIRLIYDWVQVFARQWRPKGVSLIVAEGVYTVTDPPLKLLRRLIPPVRMGSISLDVGFLILIFACYILQTVFGTLAVQGL